MEVKLHHVDKAAETHTESENAVGDRRLEEEKRTPTEQARRQGQQRPQEELASQNKTQWALPGKNEPRLLQAWEVKREEEWA